MPKQIESPAQPAFEVLSPDEPLPYDEGKRRAYISLSQRINQLEVYDNRETIKALLTQIVEIATKFRTDYPVEKPFVSAPAENPPKPAQLQSGKALAVLVLRNYLSRFWQTTNLVQAHDLMARIINASEVSKIQLCFPGEVIEVEVREPRKLLQ